jgi:FkbH-like protein
MKLLDALEVLKQPIFEPAADREFYLACGFTPLHLKTFLSAHLRLCFPQDRIEIRTGLYGDLVGNLERLRPTSALMVCVVLEWEDLDPRLGVRSLGGWRSADIPCIVESARRQSERLVDRIKRLAERTPVYLSVPSLPLPPMFATRGAEAHHFECQLWDITASLATALSVVARVKLLNVQRLGEISPLARRFDMKAEITTGFPYTLEHASSLAELLAALIQDSPKKGLITDLDDTLWAGILGEIGVDRITWDMAGHAHMHGLYQQFLGSLASAGVLIAAASKNERALVEQALARPDMILSEKSVFPLEAHWNPKSESVGRILETWNIGPADVVFIDDSPMEVAEVQASFPKMECIVFPKADHGAFLELLKKLRDQFGKSLVSAEDEIRLDSIRSAAEFRNSMKLPEFSADDFLRSADAKLSFTLKPDVQDNRALELINKTNQFNLNGRRLTESEWLAFLQESNAFVLTATYEDRFGSLGKIAVALGKTVDSKIHLNSWVMSCRAFSRRIEHQCLKFLYEKLNVDEIVFNFESTSRNEPIRNFFVELLGKPASPNCSLQKALFQANLPALFHRVVDSEKTKSQLNRFV